MAEIATFERVLWGLTFSLKALLLALLLYRKNYRTYPLFFAYIFVTLMQSIAVFECYRIWGFHSPISMRFVWGTQVVVISARAMAIAEICQRVLANYRGIWALGWRILLATVTVVLITSWVAARGSWQFAILNADRGLELAIAAALVVLFLFAHYYEVAVEQGVRFLALGFFLYSCFMVLNNTVLEGWLYKYADIWNLLRTLAFLASLSLWSWTLRESQPEMASEPEMHSGNVYRTLAPEINIRLKALNEHLRRFWHAGAKEL